MASLDRPRITYNVARMAEDMAAKGWLNKDLARKAAVSEMAVSRFLRRERQTARMAKALAHALGFSPRRYIVASAEAGQ